MRNAQKASDIGISLDTPAVSDPGVLLDCREHCQVSGYAAGQTGAV